MWRLSCLKKVPFLRLTHFRRGLAHFLSFMADFLPALAHFSVLLAHFSKVMAIFTYYSKLTQKEKDAHILFNVIRQLYKPLLCLIHGE